MTTNKALGPASHHLSSLTFSLFAVQKELLERKKSTLIRSIFQHLEDLPLFLRVLGHTHIGATYLIMCNNSLATNNLAYEKCHPKSIINPTGAPAQNFLVKKKSDRALCMVKPLGSVLIEPELHLTLPHVSPYSSSTLTLGPYPPCKEPLKSL
jgi:hypothetical protein